MANQPESSSYNVAANLLRLRLSRGWSVDHLADHAGLTVPLVEQAERGGHSLEAGVLGALADVFNVSLKELGTPPADLAQTCTDILDGDSSAPGYLEAVGQARRTAERLGFGAVAARAANAEANLLYLKGQTESAIRLALATLTRFRIHSEEDRVGLLWTLGRGWLSTDRSDVAGLVFAALVQELPGTHEDRLRALVNLGTCYRVGGWYIQAADVYRQVLDANAGVGDPKLRAWAQLGLASCLFYVNGDQEIAELVEAGEAFAREHGWDDVLDGWRSTRMQIEARRKGPDWYRGLFQECLADASSPLARAQLAETWAALEAKRGDWKVAFEAAETGLKSGSEVGSAPSHLLKARLLWWRSLAREHLNLPGADMDREWAYDLLVSEGAPKDYIERYLVSDGAAV